MARAGGSRRNVFSLHFPILENDRARLEGQGVPLALCRGNRCYSAFHVARPSCLCDCCTDLANPRPPYRKTSCECKSLAIRPWRGPGGADETFSRFISRFWKTSASPSPRLSLVFPRFPVGFPLPRHSVVPCRRLRRHRAFA